MDKLNAHANDRVIQANITELEASVIKLLRELPYGKLILTIHKVDGQPIRYELTEKNMSHILEARDGLNLDDATYIPVAVRNNFNSPY